MPWSGKQSQIFRRLLFLLPGYVAILFSYGFSYQILDALTFIPEYATPPSPRYGASIASIPADPMMMHILFGGIDEQNNYCTDLCLLFSQQNKDEFVYARWGRLSINSEEDTPSRIKAAFVSIINSTDFYLYVWGGFGPKGCYNDLYRFDFTDRIWEKLQQTGTDIPSPRFDMAYAATPNNSFPYLFIFGGHGDLAVLDDLWRLNLQTFEWTKIPTNGTGPSPREGAHMALLGDVLFVFGGLTNYGTLDDNLTIWSVSGVTGDIDASTPLEWKTVPVIPEGNESIYIHYDAGFVSAVSDQGGFALVACGKTISNGEVKNLNTLQFFDFSRFLLAEQVSVEEVKIQGLNPGSLSAVGFSIDPNVTDSYYLAFLIFGGISNGSVHGNLIAQVMKLQYSSSSTSESLSSSSTEYGLYFEPPFTLTTSVENIPSERAYHSAVAALGKMWIFGGIGPSHATALSTQQSNEVIYFNDLHSFDFQDYTWQRHEPKSTTLPPARAYASMVTFAGKLIVFGGVGVQDGASTGTALNDLWLYSILSNDWTEIIPTGSTKPDRRYHAGAVMYGRVLFIFGGTRFDSTTDNELWIFSLSAHKWLPCTIISQSGERLDNITGRSQPTLLIQPKNNTHSYLIIYGGVSAAGEPLNSADLFIIPESNNTNFLFSPVVEYVTYLDIDPGDEILGNNSYMSRYLTFPDSQRFTTETGVVSLGGTFENSHQFIATFVNFSDPYSPTVSRFNGFSATEENPYPGGSAVLFGRWIYSFGGKPANRDVASRDTFSNLFRAYRLNTTFSCSPGTYSSSDLSPDPKPFPDGCLPAPPGHFLENYSSTEDDLKSNQCWAGSANPYYGAQYSYECTPCNSGTYSTLGSAECIACPAGAYCPPGSTKPNNTLPPSSLESNVQPELYQTLDKYSTLITLAGYVAGLFLGVIVALIFCCFTPTRNLLHYLDCFSSNHSDNIDPQTNSGPKMIRKTGMGGFLSVVYLVFVVCVALSIFIQWRLNNITETKSLISILMDKEIHTDNIELRAFRAQLILTEYEGYCVEHSNVTTTEFGPCASDITFDKQNIHFYDSEKNEISHPYECKQEVSSNDFRNVTHTHCTIRIAPSGGATLSFPDESSHCTISVDTLDQKAAYGVSSLIETNTGILRNKKEEYNSSRGYLYVPSENVILRGSDPTDLSYTLMGSSFVNYNGKKLFGVQVMSNRTIPGSTADGDDFYTKYGLHIQLSLSLEPSIVRTTRSRRQEFSAMATDVLSSFVSFLSAFGGALLAYEIIRGFDYPRQLRFIPAIINKLSAPLDPQPPTSQHSESTLTVPLNSDFSSSSLSTDDPSSPGSSPP